MKIIKNKITITLSQQLKLIFQLGIVGTVLIIIFLKVN